MITLKSPMVLESLSSIEIYSDMIGPKIMGNYSVIGTNITSEDLMYMTAQPPEVFVNVENSGSILSDNNFNVDNSVKLELINQLFNRVMLYGSEKFTYQDEVFVSSILQKIGITNLEEFISQVKSNMERNKLITALINKYLDINNQSQKLVDAENSNIENNNVSAVNINNKYDTDLYIQNEIFKRLNTAECINTVYDYNNLNTPETKVPSVTDITFIEQADQIQITQLREKLLSQSAPSVWSQYCQYETKSLEINELSKESIIKRISMAVLENLFDKISYLSQQSYTGNIWRNFTSAIYKSSTDVIERFKDYQTSYENLSVTEINAYNSDMGRLIGDEIQLADLILVTNAYDILENNEEYVNDAKKNILISILENQNIQKQVSERLRLLIKENTDNIFARNIYETDELNYLSQVSESRNFYAALRQNESPAITVYGKQTLPENEASDGQIYNNISNIILENINEIIEDNDVEISTNVSSQDNYVQDLLNRFENIEYSENVPIAENIEFIEQLNSHNLYMKQLLDSTEKKEIPQPKRVVVDKKKAMQNALKAIETPEILKQEILENGVTIERELPSEIEHILSITDDNTRSFYEKIISEIYNIDNVNVKNKIISQNINDISERQNSMITENHQKDNYITHFQNIEENGKTSVIVPESNKKIFSDENSHETENVPKKEIITQDKAGLGKGSILKKELERILKQINEKTHDFYEKHIEYQNNESEKYYTDKTEIYNDNDIIEKNEINIKNMERILNSIENETDVNNAVTKINNIITNLQNSISIEAGKKGDYITYFQSISDDLEKLQTIIIQEYKKVSLLEKELNTEIVSGLESEIQKQIDYVLLRANKTAQNFYDELVLHKNIESERYFINNKSIYSDNDIINQESEISIQNVESILRSINNETDISNAVTKINNIISSLQNVTDIHHREITNRVDKTVENKYDITNTSEERLNSYVVYLKNIINELENTKIINQAITENSALVEKYIREEIEKILKTTDEYKENTYDESLIKETEYKENTYSERLHKKDLYKEDFVTEELYREIIHNTENAKYQKDFISDSIKDIMILEHINLPDSITNISTAGYQREVNLVHTSKENLQEDIVQEVVENIKRDTEFTINTSEQVNESQVTVKQLQEMKKELIRQSEESVTRIVNQNIQTQVHAISDMVYLELEKRLRNEQRRRGY
jgi:hypothetical protein